MGVPVDVTCLLRILSQMTESHRHWKVQARSTSGIRQESNQCGKYVIGCYTKDGTCTMTVGHREIITNQRELQNEYGMTLGITSE